MLDVNEVPEKAGESIALPRSEQVYRQLKADIMNARILPSERIYESVIVEQFDASRTPVREALQRLHSDGLLDRNGRAYVVPEITLQLVFDVYSAREALECKVLELLPQTGVELAGISAHLDVMQDALTARDYEMFSRADMAFHLEIARECGNRFLEDLLSTVWDKVLLIRNIAFRQPARIEESLIEHRRIVAAIRRGHVPVAVEEMRAHLRSVPEILKTELGKK